MAKGKKIQFAVSNFSEPIYNCEFEVYFGNVEEVSQFYSQNYSLDIRLPCEDESGYNAGLEPAAFFIYDHIRQLYVMVFGRNPKPDEIAHECLHAALKVLTHVGFNLGSNPKAGDDEPLAYLLSYLVRMVYHSRREARKKK